MTTNNIEVEKKYRLTCDQYWDLVETLRLNGRHTIYEENILYQGIGIDPSVDVLRLRIESLFDEPEPLLFRSLLTYKKRFPTSSDGIKRAIEEETVVEEPEKMKRILEGLGYRPYLIYEKQRLTCKKYDTEVALDILPFGYYMEIEGNEENIKEVEKFLNTEHIVELKVEMESYPGLTKKHGVNVNGVIEARF